MVISGTAVGYVVTFGEHAAAALEFSDNTCAVAVASWGAGRVVAFPKHHSLGPDRIEDGDTPKLVSNAIRWSASVGDGIAAGSINVAAVDPDVHKILVSLGFSTTFLPPTQVTSLRLAEHHALVLGSVIDTGWRTEPEDEQFLLRSAVADFVAGGGGLLVADTGWGWPMWWGGMDKCIGNKLLREAGILFRDEYSTRYLSNDGLVIVGTDVVATTSTSPVQGLSEPVRHVPSQSFYVLCFSTLYCALTNCLRWGWV